MGEKNTRAQGRPKTGIETLTPTHRCSFLGQPANNPDVMFKHVLFQINKVAIPDKAEPKVKETSP